MLKTKALIRLAFLGAAISWLIMVFADVTVLFSDLKGLDPDVPAWLPRVMLDAFILCLFYYYKLRIERDESLNFTDLLWKVFATGLIVTVISLAIRFLGFLLGNTPLPANVLYQDFVYQIDLSLFLSFLLAAFTSWKRLILYQKSKWLIRLWRVFEISLLVVLLYDSILVAFSEGVMTFTYIVIGVMVLILSANMKWVAYLNFRQKWTSLLLLLLCFFYLGYFLLTMSAEAEQIAEKSSVFMSFYGHVFNLVLCIFVLVYASFSFLVILFNLPTSSVFEQKLEEVINYQRISQSIQTEQNEESVYRILLESSVSSVFADAAWLEIRGEGSEAKTYTYQITEKESEDIRKHLQQNQVRGVLEQSSDRTRHLSKHLEGLKGARFRSIMSFPVIVKGETIGTLTLLKELPEAFTKEMTRIVSTFANQAGISIENFRLMGEAFQNERYKEELKIAKTVQRSLLPQRLEQDVDFEVAAFSESADEVGGDYYDTLRINDHQVGIIIADVSGKGTTAAFHMSQMKGIFHSLGQQALDPSEFMIRANQALVYCLERGSFISATYFALNTQTKKIHYARAGHCPVLYYRSATGELAYLKDKGTALGMIRSRDYCHFVETNEITYAPGDVMVLYTDGITEAKGAKGDEFGEERLVEAVRGHVHLPPKEIEQHIIRQLYNFSGSEDINDDYTLMVIKFR
ncbi:MAG: SpoIIE family protein phosphatase [Cyclobacteriaceae bacterium]|jgi:serine phosphatase RsbU (regulator of sigma subunit)|nr:SpoIIE family protein phosphatase [Cyclobacteriaceae bacterium]